MAAEGKVRVGIFGRDVSFGSSLNQAAGKAAAFQRQLAAVSAGMVNLGRGMTTYVSLPLAAVGVASVKMALDFEKSMTNVEALVGMSGEQVAKFKDQILELGPAVGKSPKELADAFYFIASSGLKGGAAMRALTASAKASAAGLGDTMVIADAVTSAIGAYGEKNLSAARATDILTAAVREGKSDPEEFATSIGRVIPIASKMGVTFGEVSGIMAAMSLNGTDADEAVTQISAVLSSAIKPTKDGAAALKEVGLSYADVRKEIKDKGLTATVADLNERFGGNIETLGRLFPNIRALRGFLALTGAEATKYAGIIGRVSKAQGDANKAFQVAIDKPGARMAKAWAGLQAAMVRIGDVLLPVVADLADALGKVADAVSDLSPGMQKFVVKAGIAAAAMGPLLIGVGQVGGGVSALIGLWNKVTGATNKAAAAAATARASGAGGGGLGAGNAAKLGVVGAAAAIVLGVLIKINAETRKFNKLADENAAGGQKAFLQWQALTHIKFAETGLEKVTKQLADHKISAEQAAGVYDLWLGKLRAARAAAEKIGDSAMVAKINGLIAQYKGLAQVTDQVRERFGAPLTIHTTEVDKQISATKDKISGLKDIIAALSKQEATPAVKVAIAQAKKALKEAQAELKRLNAQHAQPHVTVNNKQALAALDAVLARQRLLRDREITYRIVTQFSTVGKPVSGHTPTGAQFGGSYSGGNPFGRQGEERRSVYRPGVDDKLGLAWSSFQAILGQAGSLAQAVADIKSSIVDLTKSIMSTVNLWPDYVETVDELGNKVRTLQLPTVEAVNPDDLSKVMDANLANMRGWVANMDKLRAAGMPQELLDELTSMGLGGAGQVAGLAAMTADQLAAWTKGWLELQKLAGSQAEATYKDSLKAAEQAVRDFTQVLIDAINKLGKAGGVGSGSIGAADQSVNYNGTIAKLASGGIVTRPTLAHLAEAGRAEGVFPLPADWRSSASRQPARMAAPASSPTASSPTVVNVRQSFSINVQSLETDERVIAKFAAKLQPVMRRAAAEMARKVPQ